MFPTQTLDDVVLWLKIGVAVMVLCTAALLIFLTPRRTKRVVSQDNHDPHREAWKPYPGYDGTQEP